MPFFDDITFSENTFAQIRKMTNTKFLSTREVRSTHQYSATLSSSSANVITRSSKKETAVTKNEPVYETFM